MYEQPSLLLKGNNNSPCLPATCPQAHPGFSYRGKLVPMRIRPRGYVLPFTVTGGLTSRFPKESRLVTGSKRGSRVT